MLFPSEGFVWKGPFPGFPSSSSQYLDGGPRRHSEAPGMLRGVPGGAVGAGSRTAALLQRWGDPQQGGIPLEQAQGEQAW